MAAAIVSRSSGSLFLFFFPLSILQIYFFSYLHNGTSPHPKDAYRGPARLISASSLNFFQTFSPFSLHIPHFIPTFAIATIYYAEHSA